MHTIRLLCLLSIFCLVSVSVSSQQSTPTITTSGPQTPQAASILQQSIAAMTGGAPVTDVTMTGTMTITTNLVASGNVGSPLAPQSVATTAGANTDTGTVTLVATSAGRTQSTVTTSTGTHTEIRDISGGWPTLTVIGTDGVVHTVTTQSALAPHPASFYLPFVLTSGLSSAIYASSYVGEETWNGASVQHISVWMVPGGSWSGSGQLLQQSTQHDIYLDPSSLLPVGMTFTVHPYDPANPNRLLLPLRDNSVDSVEQVQYSQYQQVQGRSVPFHTRMTFQATHLSAVIDVQFTSVNFNTGAAVTVPIASAN
jgi:hypothetical protein